jgi:Flavin containing amine oxidoreductase
MPSWPQRHSAYLGRMVRRRISLAGTQSISSLTSSPMRTNGPQHEPRVISGSKTTVSVSSLRGKGWRTGRRSRSIFRSSLRTCLLRGSGRCCCSCRSMTHSPGQLTTLCVGLERAEGLVHFAGEHISACPYWMQGALQSGLRAAKEVNGAT